MAFGRSRRGATEQANASLLDALRAGDEAAFTSLIDAHHDALLRIVTGICGASAAEDVVQETWTSMLEHIDAFEGRSSLKTWIFSIALNKAKTRSSRDGRFVSFDAPMEDGPAVPPERFVPDGHWAQRIESWSDASPERSLLLAETRVAIQRALETLPVNQRTVLTLRDVDGLESAEVCNVMGITESNQRVLLHRARTRMREALDRYLRGEGS